MKKTLLHGVYLVLACGGAWAATRIMPPEINCRDIEFSQMKFGAICNNGKEELGVYGVATCAADGGDRVGFAADGPVVIDVDDDENIHCWCRLADPFVSQNVFVNTYLYAGECENWCASECARALKSNGTFRTAMFSNLKKQGI